MKIRDKIYTTILMLLFLVSGCSDSTNQNNLNLLEPSPPNELKLQVAKIESSEFACPYTEITFEQPEGSWVHLEIKNATGYTVKVLYDDYLDAGSHLISWDNTNDDNKIVKKGIYITYLTSASYKAWYPAYYCMDDCGN